MGPHHPQAERQVEGVVVKKAQDGQQGWLASHHSAFSPAQLNSPEIILGDGSGLALIVLT